MIEHPAVRKVNFTGSTATGRKIARTCGENLKPCLMELGGKNSAIVCADADIQVAVREVLAGTLINVAPQQPPWRLLTDNRAVWPDLYVDRPNHRPRRHRASVYGCH
jgi:hypothetical protein